MLVSDITLLIWCFKGNKISLSDPFNQRIGQSLPYITRRAIFFIKGSFFLQKYLQGDMSGN